MSNDSHYRALERMYAHAPINRFYQPTLTVGDGVAEVSIAVDEHLYHAAGAVHGSVYFKLLDDAAWFAANSLERDFFVLTSSFTTYMTRPVTGARMTAHGKVVQQTRTQFLAEAVLLDDQGRDVGRGNGLFVRGPGKLVDMPGYGSA